MAGGSHLGGGEKAKQVKAAANKRATNKPAGISSAFLNRWASVVPAGRGRKRELVGAKRRAAYLGRLPVSSPALVANHLQTMYQACRCRIVLRLLYPWAI